MRRKEDPATYLGDQLLADLEAGSCGGKVTDTLMYVQYLFDQIQGMPGISKEAKNGACYASVNIGSAIDRCKEIDAQRKEDLQ